MIEKRLKLSRNRVTLLLVGILAIAIAVRLPGILDGYPLVTHPDEPLVVQTALRILKTRDPNPNFFHYPSFSIYMQTVLSLLIGLVHWAIDGTLSLSGINLIEFYVWGRVLIVGLSVSTVIVTYEIGKMVGGATVGLLSALVLSVSFLHVINSYTITVDNPMAFWSSLAILSAILILKRGGRLRYYVLAGLFTGLAAGSKYTGGLVVLSAVVGFLIQNRGLKGLVDVRLPLLGAVLLSSFLLSTPYSVIDRDQFLADLEGTRFLYSTGHLGAESETSTSLNLYVDHLFKVGYGVLPSVFAILGTLWLLRTEWRVGTVLLVFPLALLLFIGAYRVWFPRNVVAIIPPLAVLTAVGIRIAAERFGELLTRSRDRSMKGTVQVATIVIAVMVCAGPLARSALEVWRTLLPDTRWVATQWVLENLPKGAVVGREHYTPPIEDYSDSFEVNYLGFFALLKEGSDINSLDYMIVSSGDYERFVDSEDVYPSEANTYTEFFAQHQLVTEFEPDNRTMTGPTIRIYRISNVTDE